MLSFVKQLLLKIRERDFISYSTYLLKKTLIPKKPPPYNFHYIVSVIIEKLQAKTYLEIGVFKGDFFFFQRVKRKIAVDPNFKSSRLKILTYIRKNRFFEMTSDDLFSRNPKILNKYGIDVALIDGLHTYEQSLKDVLNCLKYLNDNGYIILHDCYPPIKLQATPAKSMEHFKSLNLPKSTWCGDVWKTIPHLRSMRNDLKILVFNYDVGIGIITKGEPSSMLNYTEEEIKMLTYDDLKKNPEYIVNLKPFSYFFEFIKAI